MRSSVRDDVGPYSVTLPSYARAENSGASRALYAPFLIESCRGDELRIALKDELTGPGRASHQPAHARDDLIL